MKRAEIVASGMVQGVAFRYQVRIIAQKLGLAGHVKNLDDGTVEIVCEGEQGAIDELVEGIRVLPAPIEVQDVKTAYSEAEGLTKFEIITGDLAQEMAAGFGTGAVYMNMMMGKQDRMLEKQDKMLEKQDKTIDSINRLAEKQDKTIDSINRLAENQDKMLEKQDKTIDSINRLAEKQDNTSMAVRDLSSTVKDMMDSRFGKIEKDISEIKARLAN